MVTEHWTRIIHSLSQTTRNLFYYVQHVLSDFSFRNAVVTCVNIESIGRWCVGSIPADS